MRIRARFFLFWMLCPAVVACSSSNGNSSEVGSPRDDTSGENDGGASGFVDGGTSSGKGDGASSSNTHDAGNATHGDTQDGAMSSPNADGGDTSATSAVQGACTAGAYRCASDDTVQICGSSGTSWLYTATCTQSCASGLCTGACTPGATRCNGANVETCNPGGTAWAVSSTCTTSYCASQNTACALPALDVSLDQNLDGVVIVDGDVVVHSGATLTSPTGNLTIYARTITVEMGGSIAIAPTGQSPGGQGGPDYGGGYGTPGAGEVYDGTIYGSGGMAWGDSNASDIEPGSMGGVEYLGQPGGLGGGVLRLFASTSIDIAGQVSANGQAGVGSSYGGGGSGGGILLASDSIDISGVLSVQGGAGGTDNAPNSSGGSGGFGRIKILYGSIHTITGTLTGAVTQGLLPPIPLTSTSHPDSNAIYNDNFPAFVASWSKPFSSDQGYYVRLDQTASNPPTPANGQFLATDYTSFPTGLVAGDNYFHIAPVDTMSNVGGVETIFHVAINATPPAVASSSHPDPTAWSSNPNPYFAWTFPQGDSNVNGAYYIFDHYGSTIPDASATFLPTTQKQIQLSNIAAGVWVLHVISVDTMGYFTKVAANYRVNIGADPGSGGILGQVVDSTSHPVASATVTINRGLYTQTTDANGNYNFMDIPAGTWEIGVTDATKSATVTTTVTANDAATANVTLP